MSLVRTVTMESGPRKRAKTDQRVNNPRGNRYRKTWPNNKGWIPRYYDPFPPMQRAILRYCDDFSFNAGQATVAHQLFRANSIFDPDASGIGHQPYGHDEYSRIYNHYRVDKCIITATSGSTGTNNVMGIGVQSDATLVASPTAIRERKGTTFATLSSYAQPAKLTSVWTRKSTFPVDADGYTAQFGSNPDEEVFFDVFTCGNGITDPGTIAITVTMTFYVTMYEPRTLTGS